MRAYRWKTGGESWFEDAHSPLSYRRSADSPTIDAAGPLEASKEAASDPRLRTVQPTTQGEKEAGLLKTRERPLQPPNNKKPW